MARSWPAWRSSSAIFISALVAPYETIQRLIHPLVILKITWDSWRTVSGTDPGEMVEPHSH